MKEGQKITQKRRKARSERERGEKVKKNGKEYKGKRESKDK